MFMQASTYFCVGVCHLPLVTVGVSVPIGTSFSFITFERRKVGFVSVPI
jgi:hypothetical protein